MTRIVGQDFGDRKYSVQYDWDGETESTGTDNIQFYRATPMEKNDKIITYETYHA